MKQTGTFYRMIENIAVIVSLINLFTSNEKKKFHTKYEHDNEEKLQFQIYKSFIYRDEQANRTEKNGLQLHFWHLVFFFIPF